MDIEDEIPDESDETGSDELLSADSLRLPVSANILVRVHAVRAWLHRRQQEAAIQVGEAALHLQEMGMEEPQELYTRRRARQRLSERHERAQQALTNAQERLSAYEEAQTLLEDCIAHNNGERVLVEYYLQLEEQAATGVSLSSKAETGVDEQSRQPRHSQAWYSVIADVQHRVEHVGTPSEEEE
jgi:phage-related minor tail protein